MSHDHIGIPRFIEKGFSIKDKVYVYNSVRNMNYSMSIKRLGTENNYYDDDVEKELLASGIEKNFSLFYNEFCGITDLNKMKKILDLNIPLIEQFFSFMYMRSKKTLNQINNESVASKILGDLDHSELLRIQSIINVNPLKIIGDNYSFYPIVNFSSKLFINNSIGFGLMINKEKEYSFVIPLNLHIAILISGNKELPQSDYFYIEPDGDKKVDTINKCIVKMEKAIGNGFFFGSESKSINEYSEYYRLVQD